MLGITVVRDHQLEIGDGSANHADYRFGQPLGPVVCRQDYAGKDYSITDLAVQSTLGGGSYFRASTPEYGAERTRGRKFALAAGVAWACGLSGL